jgi:TrkA domain protein
MTDINETPLPGVGTRYDFETKEGARIGVISHYSGRRDLLLYDEDDPDSCALTMRLAQQDGRTLGELLGATHLEESTTPFQQAIGDLAIDWITIGDEWACNGQTIAQIGIRAETGIMVVAAIRGDEVISMPPPEFALQTGDTLLSIGKPENFARAITLLHGS